MDKNIAIIGASYLQLPLILKAKEMGYTTHVFAWKANDVGEDAADHFYPISITEKDQKSAPSSALFVPRSFPAPALTKIIEEITI